MNVADEKVFLYGMMKDITDERRRLSEMYLNLKTRLDQLNALEERGVSELSTKGFFDFFNDRETHIQITNVNREAQAAVIRHVEKDIPQPRYDKTEAELMRGKAEREANEAKRIAKNEEMAKAEEIAKAEERIAKLEELNAKEEELIAQALKVSEETVKQIEEENPNQLVMQDIIPKVEIELLKEKDIKLNTIKPKLAPKLTLKPEPKPKPEPKTRFTRKPRVNSGLSTKEANFLVAKILAEHKKAMSVDELRDALIKKSGFEVTVENFRNNIMNRIIKMNEHIIRPEPGHYQYQE